MKTIFGFTLFCALLFFGGFLIRGLYQDVEDRKSRIQQIGLNKIRVRVTPTEKAGPVLSKEVSKLLEEELMQERKEASLGYKYRLLSVSEPVYPKQDWLDAMEEYVREGKIKSYERSHKDGHLIYYLPDGKTTSVFFTIFYQSDGEIIVSYKKSPPLVIKK